jgi:hypothetical protein
MQDLIMQFLVAHPSLAVLITIVSVLRTVFKPIMAAIEAGVQASGSDKAKTILTQVEASKPYRVIAFVVDYLTSVKLPVVQAAVAGNSDSSSAPAK